MPHRLITGALNEPGGAVRRCSHWMEGSKLQPDRKSLQSFPKLPLWIIEHVWTHNMMDIQTVVDPSTWPEMDSQPLSLDDSWRLRVISAKVYFIVKNRDMVQFERVMGFLEATHILLPRLVSPIKHMKIMFGLKTMFIMWMLREGRGMVDVVIKINQFFPSKLPQYQDQCSPHEMFLMRKNNQDFKTLAQTLAVNKDKLDEYILNQMEQQYGEHYAQRVEDRLLHYLHKLKAMLPGDTYIDKILKKGSPVTKEEQLLLDVISSDPATIATTLKKLLHCDVVSCSLGKTYQSSVHGMENSQLSQYSLYGSSSKAPLKSAEARTPPEFKPEGLRGKEEDDQDVSQDNLWFEKENNSDAGRHQQTEEGTEVDKRVEEGSSDREKEEISQRSSEYFQEATSSPQFCSKHQRWVKSILQECPDECSEELLLQANVSQSPLLFQSSSSITSSGDLTPSDLILHPPDQQQPPTETSSHFETAVQACEQTNLEDKPNSGSLGSTRYTSQREPLPQPPSSKDSPLPALLLPVVRLRDIATVRGIHLTFKLHQSSSNHFMCSNKQAASASSPQVQNCPDCSTSGNDTMPQRNTVAPTNAQNTTHQVQKSPVSHYASTSTSFQPQTPPSFPRLSRKFRLACTNTQPQTFNKFCQNPLAEQLKRAPATLRTNCLPLSFDYNTSGPLTHDVSTSTCQSTTISSVYTANQVVPQSSMQTHPPIHISPSQLKTLRYSNVVSSTPNSSCMVRRAQFRLSLSSQAMLLQSKLLQPYVNLTRLSGQECYQMTNGRSSVRFMEPVAQGSNDNDEDAGSPFDPNILYSSHSSSNDSKDSLDGDPDYKPYIKKKKSLSKQL